jgi:hypothetical protein
MCVVGATVGHKLILSLQAMSHSILPDGMRAIQACLKRRILTLERLMVARPDI